MEIAKPFVSVAECHDIARGLDRKFATFLRQRHFVAEVSKDTRGVYAKVVLRTLNGSFYYPVEGRMAHVDNDLGDRQAAIFLLDYISEYFAEYFRENGDVYLPIDWADYEWEGLPLQLKGQIFNLEVERLANELLGQDAEKVSKELGLPPEIGL